MNDILFFYEDTSYKIKNKKKLVGWIEKVCANYHWGINIVNYIFCSDSYLLNINKEYLCHDFYTDIITFDLREDKNSKNKSLEADIYISIDRVTENAIEYNVPFKEEILRVMIHGILHLTGLNDKTKLQKEKMRNEEQICVDLF